MLIVVAFAALYFLCTERGAGLLVRPLEDRNAPLASTADTGAQAIVVLGAGRFVHAVEYGGRDIPDYIALGRLRYAAKLQHETDLPILVSGGNGLPDGAMASEADAMASALREDFRTPVKWVEGMSENTMENALFSAKVLRQNGVNRILLVTDALHMTRARRSFARTGLGVVAAPTIFLGSGGAGADGFFPSAEGLRRSRYAIHEWAGLLWYGIRYRD